MNDTQNERACTGPIGGRRRRGKLSASAAKTSAPGSPSRICATMPPRWPNTWRPENGRSWRTPSGPTIPFGTGGRRGRMYPIGCNAINDRTIGESAQGLADYVKRARSAGRPTPTGRSPAPSPTTRGIARGSSPSCAARSWPPPASRSIFSTATAARRSCRSPCATSSAIAAS